MKVLTLGIVLLLAAVVAAQAPRSGLSTRGTVTGQVSARDTGLPIPGMQIHLRFGGDLVPKVATSDADGRFRFEDLVAGVYGVTLLGPGYSAKLDRFMVKSRVETTLSLSKEAIITGRVLDERGQAMPGVEVCAFESRWSDGRDRYVPVTHEATENDGSFQLRGLLSGGPGSRGNFIVAFSPHGCGLDNWLSAKGRARGAVYPTVYAPSTLDASEAAVVSIEGAVERSGIEIRLRRSQLTTLEGMASPVSVELLQPVGRVILEPQDSAAAQNRVVTFGRDGRFAFAGVPPGTYRLIVPPAWSPTEVRRWWAVTTVTVTNAPRMRVLIATRPTTTIAGQLDFDGRPSALYETRVFFVVKATPFGERGSTKSQLPEPFTSADEKGQFSIPGIMAGRYVLGVAGDVPLGWMMSGATVQGPGGASGDRIDVFNLPLTVRPEAHVRDVRISLTRSPAVLAVKVTADEGDSVRGSTVVLVPADPKYWWQGSPRLRAVPVDAGGSAVFERLPAGDFFVTAVRDLARNWSESEALEAMRLGGTPIRLELGQHQDVWVRLTSRGRTGRGGR